MVMEDTYKIIIADDHPLFRSALQQAVQTAVPDAQLLEAENVNDLLKLLELEREPDLLLLDLKMPGANGFSAFTHLHGQYPELPIVVISASEEVSVVQKAKQLGATGFIPKSTPLQQLVAAIQHIIEGDDWFPEGISFSAQAEEDPLAERLASLTPQQYKVLVMLNEGLLNKQIAYELNVSEATIKAHVTAIFRKLNVKNRTQAVIALQQLELEPSPEDNEI
ncbi:DNA-binding response regulator [Agarivorans sp. OAG1]|jgi:DNA-binding NarL/FixJ family response regulator|uniref:Transcriptional regulator n=1 Tax=Agarivorans albus MKT 106 TaxID=1331007 RepID=R9PLT0_AGAAL|nr:MULTISPECIES: response regulator transcription factor [Agarivorans]BEU01685.1 DNA-binding response regulator [Agarivorans sp. OAG1]GAD02280.1 transcriptional regulator [Agarivorans albus MKT 106]